MQVIAPGVTIHINDFAGKKEAGNKPGFHGLGINFPGAHTAGGDDGLRDWPKPIEHKPKLLETANKMLSLLPGDLI